MVDKRACGETCASAHKRVGTTWSILPTVLKKVGLLWCLLPMAPVASAQAGQWAWMKGDTVFSPGPMYGIQGVPSPLNTPPGLYEFPNWVDAQGRLWIFGGDGNGGMN